MTTTTTTPAPAGAGPTGGGSGPGRGLNLNAVLVEGRALIALVIIIAIFAILSDNYLTTGNLTTITKQVAFNAIVAIGMLLVILNGGIDVGAKGEIFSLLFREAKKGLAVLYVTSEVGEALTASHRIIVMSKGRIVKEFDPRTCTRDEIMAASGEHETDFQHPAAPGDTETLPNGAQR